MDGDTIALPRSRKENKDHDYRFIFAKSYTYCVIQIHMAWFWKLQWAPYRENIIPVINEY